MIVFENVTKFFPTKNGRKYILRDVSFTLKTGENVGVIGPNGAGKTTMMRLICGVDVPNSGRIDTSYFLSWPMGLAGGLQGAMSGRENAKFVCRILGEPEHQIAEKLEFIQEFAEIGRDFELPVQNYSSGMRARLNFAISMSFKFDCYVVDELTAVGDQRFREKSARFFKEKRDEACFIKVSHNLKELQDECDSSLLIMDGKLFYFPEVLEGIEAYQATLKGAAPDTLDDYLVSKPERTPGVPSRWLSSLSSFKFKAPKQKSKSQTARPQTRELRLPKTPEQPNLNKLLVLPPKHVARDLPELGAAKPKKPSNSDAPDLRAAALADLKSTSERFTRTTDILERLLEHKKVQPPG